MSKPRLTFFCELAAGPLQELFAGSVVIQDLSALQAGVSLGILDLSPERAVVVRRLNEAGIPVVAWQLLSEEEGYWFNLGNAAQAATRYQAFKRWTAEYGLQWAGLGLDIEPDIREAQQLMRDKWRLLPALLQRILDSRRLHRAQAAYSALVAQIRVDGYPVDSYQIPFIVDERKVGSSLLQRLGGLVDIAVDREVLMLYSSFLRPTGVGMLWSYAQEAKAVAVGSTGGGVTVGGVDRIPPLSWNELARDLRLAARWSNDIYLFSLEGCVRQGFLARLKAFDWSQPVVWPFWTARKVEQRRSLFRVVLWGSAHPLLVLGAALGLGWVLRWLVRDKE